MSEKRDYEKWMLGAALGLNILLLGLVGLSIFWPGLRFLTPALAIICGLAGFACLLWIWRLRKRWIAERDRAYYYDKFTGLGNGRLLEQIFDAKQDRANLIYVLIRLNRFHEMNSLFGLDLAGNVIQRLSQPLRRFAQAHDGIAARPELDHYSLLVTSGDEELFRKELRSLLKEMERINVEDKDVSYCYHYTFTYGIYFFGQQESGIQLDKVRRLVSGAMNRAMSLQGTSGTVFTARNRPDWTLQEKLSGRVSEAWEKREFVPYYQPIYDLRTGKPVAAELLARWAHPEWGLLLPGSFLSALEEKGLIMDLDLYMLEEACKKVKGWLDQELLPVPLSVNLSKLNIHREDFVERVVALVEKYNIPPVLIDLELTEPVVLFEKNDAFFDIMKRLHQCGFTLSMDNFAATDFSSINIFRDLPVDVIKINSRFFGDSKAGKREQIFVRNVLRMTQELGIKVVAEGMENEQQVALIRGYGCGYGQGYYFSKPISNAAFEKLIF